MNWFGQLAYQSTFIASHPWPLLSSLTPTQIMHEIPPEDEKPKKNWFSSNPRPAPKPDPKPKPKPKPDPKPRHTAERERRQVKLAQKARSHTPSEPAKKGNKDSCCGCIVLLVLVALGLAFFL